MLKAFMGVSLADGPECPYSSLWGFFWQYLDVLGASIKTEEIHLTQMYQVALTL